MKSILKKAVFAVATLVATTGVAKADKGMWLLNELNCANIEKMKELGFQLSPDSLYSLDKPSVANSSVIFGRGCTGVTVSNQGLIMTNHHCGYSSIQQVSSVNHDYLRDGFVSQSLEEELPIEGLTVRYLDGIKDVTGEILKYVGKKVKNADNPQNEEARSKAVAEAISALVAKEKKQVKDESKAISIVSYYAGNKYYMVTYNVFSDVRMVFAPPSSIGKFGGDTDNWMWPRHTGDFSVFRVYAGKDNKPAKYSKENVPYRPKYSAAISTEGYKPGDYAMTIGFPGSTARYIPSWGVERRMMQENEPRIVVRGAKQAIWRKAMEADQATRIKYSDKYAGSSNYWKNSIGMNKALRSLGVVEAKRAEEASFAKWAEGQKKYANVLKDLEKVYKESSVVLEKLMYLSETLLRGSEIVDLTLKVKDGKVSKENLEKLYKDYVPSLDEEVLPVMLDLLRPKLSREEQAIIFDVIDRQFAGDTKAYAKDLFARSIFPYQDKALAFASGASLSANILDDPALALASAASQLRKQLAEQYKHFALEEQRTNRLYFAGRQAQDPSRQMPSDANFTMRMSYGTISGYEPRDAVEYDYFTTPKGILEKYEPGSYEFDLKPEFLSLLQSGDWGRWADKKDGQLYVNFLSNNDITGGNSGSPVFDKNGRVIALAFDGNWEAMSGDIEFEPNLQRTISVDIRYVLFVIDKWGKCPRLIEELTLL